MTASNTYFIRLRGVTKGPLSVEKLKKLAQTGQFTRSHQISTDGKNWSGAEEFKDLFPVRAAAPVKSVGVTLSAQVTTSSQSNSSSAETSSVPRTEEVREWQYAIGQQQNGPVTLDELRLMYDGRQIKANTLIWKKGLRDWIELRHVIPLPKQAGVSRKMVASIVGVVAVILLMSGVTFALLNGDSEETTTASTNGGGGAGVVNPAGGAPLSNALSKTLSSVAETIPPVPASQPESSTTVMVTPVEVTPEQKNAPVVSKPIESSDLTKPEVSREYDQAVGIVISYLEITQGNGTKTELTLGHGTGFLVNSLGTMLTNKHVIEDHSLWEAASVPGRRERLYDLHLSQLSELVAKADISDAKKAEILNETKDELKVIATNVEKITPKLVVYFGDEQFAAELEYTSHHFDLAVLKTPCRDRSFFALSQENRQPKLSDVMSLGFPGVSMAPISDAARDLQKSIQARSSFLFGDRSFTDAFKARKFEMTATLGVINLVQEEVEGVYNVQHSATIRQGNSGGPLVLRTGAANGVVYGINTLGVKDTLASSNVAFPVAQMRRELEGVAKVTGLVWK